MNYRNIIIALLLSAPSGLLAATGADSTIVTTEINYLEEFQKGGAVGIALAVLCLALIACVIERLISLRAGSICPHGLTSTVLPLWDKREFLKIVEACKKQPSVLARMTLYFVEHRTADPELLIPGANDIAVRELRRHTQRAHFIAVIAGLAPLLGLLGTMIGMIESFKLVEIYGDDGGASMLAGAISKALVTTAMGLIIAIPALCLYHLLKYRIGVMANRLEEEIEILINCWFLKADTVSAAASHARVRKKASGEKDTESSQSTMKVTAKPSGA